ncbi:MAG: BatD family protein, partial [Victivallaceae bacterium]
MGRFALFCILLFTLLSWNLSAADGEVLLSASSPQVAAGGEFVLKLSAEGSVTPTLLETPDAITVLSVSRSSYSQSINGQTTMESSSNYNVAIEQPGEYTIGPLKAKLGSKEFTTNVVKVKVLAPEKISVPVMDKKSGDVVNSEIGDLVFGSGEFPGGRTKFYVGEDIPLSLKLYVADNSNFSLSYPVIDAG